MDIKSLLSFVNKLMGVLKTIFTAIGIDSVLGML